ncbi:MAG TPA: TetR/AcrR family transcriptional regulator [Beijerinckiaceae bacterium]|jgi:AcrR family transcriptional regulator
MLDVTPQLDPRTRILAAAETCFARSGFHRATMQDVAREAGMSPGNLYRYFPSKAAIVAGLCQRDQEELSADLAGLSGGGDLIALFAAMARKHLVEEPRERAALILEIWAEASRNPDIAAISAEFERGLKAGLAAVIEAGKVKGDVPASVDTAFAVRVMCMAADGLFKRRVIDADFNADRDIAAVLAVFSALLKGAITTPDASHAA